MTSTPQTPGAAQSVDRHSMLHTPQSLASARSLEQTASESVAGEEDDITSSQAAAAEQSDASLLTLCELSAPKAAQVAHAESILARMTTAQVDRLCRRLKLSKLDSNRAGQLCNAIASFKQPPDYLKSVSLLKHALLPQVQT